MKNLRTCLLAAAAMLLLSACGQKQSADNAAVPPAPLLTDTISATTAQRLVNNFNDRAYRVIKKRGPLPDTRCVWFSLRQLKALVAKIDSEKGDGIRFYSAAYDKERKPDIAKIDTNYLDYATLVMVSTRAKNGFHYDYYANEKNSNGKMVHKGAILMGVPENTGELCPPPAKCSTVGATLLP
jgi:hypothetical protein